jgi:hypothetical protein
MKRLLLSIFALLSYCAAQSQAVQVWCENFDGGTISTTSSGTPGWSVDPNYQVSSPNCLKGEYQTGGGVVTLTSPVFSTAGLNFVLLDFSQICKIKFVDDAQLEYSIDGGTTWVTFNAIVGDPGQNVTYNGAGVFQALGNAFAESSYSGIWAPNTTTAPTNGWWVQENFDISLAVGNQATVQIRFKITDVTNSGMQGRYGWLLDNICVTAAPCELNPPTASAPAVGFPLWQGTVFNLGPFDFFVNIDDPSGIAHPFVGPGFAELFYSINGTPFQSTLMVNLTDSIYAGTIPAALPGDTICWYFEGYDNSGCSNMVRYPAVGEICFYPVDGIHFPFCDNFEMANNLWTPDPTFLGTPWVYGTPTGPTLATAHSPTNVYGVGNIGGVGAYLDNSSSILYSPIFDFSTTNISNLSFWQNRDCESGWDGVRLEFSNDAGTTWNVIGTQNDPNATNWYTNNSINSSLLPAWDGSSNGWQESRYKLGTVPGLGNSLAVQFRYVFTSDPSVPADGFHLDDFCITVPCNDDLGANVFISPTPGSGQPAGGTVNLNFVIENYGQLDQSGFNIGWSINGVVQTPVPFVGTLTAGTTTNFLIPNTPVLPNAYTICVWTDLTTDCEHLNDTLCATFIGIPTLIPSPSYCDDFESGNIGWSNQVAAGGNIGTIWELGAPGFGNTTGANSGANAWDVNLLSGYTNNANCELYSPYFDFSAINAGRIQFALNYNTELGSDGTRLEYSNDNGATWNTLGTGSSTNPDPCGTNWYDDDFLNATNTNGWAGNSGGWKTAGYRLCCTSGIFNSVTPVQFRFVFVSNGFTPGDGISIDDFCIYAATGADAGISAIQQPLGSAPAGNSVGVAVTLENHGITTITTTQITYTINGSNPTTITWNGSLAPCGQATVVLPNTTVLPGVNVICSWTTLPGDVEPANDTICSSFIGIPLIVPSPSYCDDFESGNIGWTNQLGIGGDPGTNWELGLPSAGATVTANSGVNAWDINLTSQYTDDALSYLYTPYFDFATIGAGRIDFAMNYSVENAWDGVRLEYTTDNGATWITVGSGDLANPDPCGINWYVDAQLNSSNTFAWTGNSGGWIQSGYKLCCTTGIFNNPIPVQFRFVFTSDPSVPGDGFSIDDFCIYAATGDDVGITAITQPFGGAPVGASFPVVVTLENFGATTITSTPITYTVNGLNPVTFIWTGSLPPCGVTTVTLPNFTFGQGLNTICAWTSLPTDQEPSNDTTCTDVIGQPYIQPTYINSYNDDFESGNIGWAPYVISGGNPACIWEFGTPAFGTTTGAYSPTNCWDVNLNSGMLGNANTVVTTPFFDFQNAQAAILRFYQNRAIYTFGDEMFIEYSVNSGPWTLLQPTTQTVTNWYNNVDSWDDNSGGWIQSAFKDVTSAVGGLVPLVQFRFVYTSGGFTNGDGVSVDNFEIFVPIPLSVKTLAVNTSVPCQFIFPGQPITFAAPINNNGINTVFNHNISLTIDGTLISNDPVSYVPAGLLPDSSQTHNFNNTWIAVPGFHQVCVYTDSPNGSLDLNQFDDTSCTTVLVFDSVASSQLPFCTSFESGNQWVTSNAFTYCTGGLWQQGTPAKTNLNGAHTGNTAWTTNLATNYANKDSSGLFSSLFRVQAGHCYKLSFWQEFRMEYGSDGGALDYSTDYGVTWNRMDLTGTPNIQLYGASPNYTYVSELDPNDPSLKGFTGYRNNWFQTEKTFRPGVDAQVVIRWRFASDFSATEEGWSIDDVCFEDLGLCSPVGIDEFAINDFGMSQNYPNPAGQSTTFEYMIPTQGQVRIVMSDMIGQIVSVIADENVAAGKHTVVMNTASLAPGLYTYTLVYDGQQITKRMIITR